MYLFILMDYELLIHGLYHLFPHRMRRYIAERAK